MEITTVITTYRRPLLLKRAIQSILKQTYPHFKVCIYDNASGDETERIVRELMLTDSRIHYHQHPKNIGMMPNYEYALAKIDTPYFSFLSDDDFLLPHFYEIALKNFEKFPDVAFSACSVVQMDENGNFVGDPLAHWSSEGYYSAAEGLFEMMKNHWKFPIPTGVLFQLERVKDIKPDFSQDIELFWDPDYLIRIAAAYPIVISKKHSGVYLAHSESYASSYYLNLFKNISNCEKYLIATKKIMLKIKQNKSINKDCKVQNLFGDCVQRDVACFMETYRLNNKQRGVHFLARKYYHYFGFSKKIAFLQAKAISISITGWHLLKMAIKYLLSRFFHFTKREPVQSSSINLSEIQSYHQYGKELLENS